MQQEKDGATIVVPYGRPIIALNQKELQKKINNRQSALNGRKRAKQKEKQLSIDHEKFTSENMNLKEENKQLQLLIEKYRRNVIQLWS